MIPNTRMIGVMVAVVGAFLTWLTLDRTFLILPLMALPVMLADS